MHSLQGHTGMAEDLCGQDHCKSHGFFFPDDTCDCLTMPSVERIQDVWEAVGMSRGGTK